MKLRVLKEAETDITDAARWYDQTSRELAERFLGEIADGLEEIERHPKRHAVPPTYRGKLEVRRYMLPSFNYMIVYQIEPKEVLAICVIHSKRNPRRWKKRIQK